MINNMFNESISYDDVQLVPYHSDLKSRKEADVSMHGYSLPIVMSPMNTVTTPQMIKLFVEYGCIPTLHRYFNSAKEQYDYLTNGLSAIGCNQFEIDRIVSKTFFAVGSVYKYKEWIDSLVKDYNVTNLMVDMAHGDSTLCVETCNYINSLNDKLTVIAGNVATKSGYLRLQNTGIKGIRCGIGGGCFTPKMKVDCLDSTKSIEDVKVGDSVLTHKRNLKKVVNIFKDYVHEPLLRINGIFECTKNHEFFVIHKDNVNDFLNHKKGLECFEWVAAEELTTDFFLLDQTKHRIGSVVAIEEFDYDGYVYDLTVEDDHSYNIFGFIVHNSICATRLNTAFGVPTLTSIINCNQIKEDSWLLADGGIKNTGDIVKAIRFGADFVMIGKLLAQTDLACGKCFNYKRELIKPGTEIFDESDCVNEGDYNCLVKYREYMGMASREARNGIFSDGPVEGHAGLVKYYGKTIDFLNEVKSNLQSALSYGGCRKWSEFKRVKVIRNSIAAINEADTHLDINFYK